MHWTRKYIGKKWVAGARGPDVWDCWGLLCEVYRQECRVELPHYGNDCRLNLTGSELIARFAHESGSGRWVQVDKPKDFDAVALSRSKRVFHHCGVFVDQGRGMVLHCNEGINTVCQRVDYLRTQFRRIEFFRYVQD